MKTYLIALTSITYALKAKKKLNEMGYNCEVQRTPKNLSKGCGYSIRVKGNLQEYCKVLSLCKIKYLDTLELASDYG